jgi:hypothetical protein
MVSGDLKNTAVRALGDQRVTIGQTLGAADERAVKPGSVERHDETRFDRRILPDDFK